jgi:hypothetical protein
MVITGKGRYFTAGIDLNGAVGNRHGDSSNEGVHPSWNLRRNLSQPDLNLAVWKKGYTTR